MDNVQNCDGCSKLIPRIADITLGYAGQKQTRIVFITKSGVD
jgi:coenzyme F420-reducing hydrogenase beta subunit